MIDDRLADPWRYAAISIGMCGMYCVATVTFSTIMAYQKSQRNMHNGLQVTVTRMYDPPPFVYSAKRERERERERPKWLPLNFGYHDVMRTSPIPERYRTISVRRSTFLDSGPIFYIPNRKTRIQKSCFSKHVVRSHFSSSTSQANHRLSAGLALLLTYGQRKALALMNVLDQVRPTLECAGVLLLTCLAIVASFVRAMAPKE